MLRAEFTPTTLFCPQSNTLTRASFRAWNGPSNCHESDLVRVRVAEMHHQSAAINERLETLEDTDREPGTVTPQADRDEGTGPGHDEDVPFEGGGSPLSLGDHDPRSIWSSGLGPCVHTTSSMFVIRPFVIRAG